MADDYTPTQQAVRQAYFTANGFTGSPVGAKLMHAQFDRWLDSETRAARDRARQDWASLTAIQFDPDLDYSGTEIRERIMELSATQDEAPAAERVTVARDRETGDSEPDEEHPEQERAGVTWAMDWLTENGHESASRALGLAWWGIEYDGDEPPNDSSMNAALPVATPDRGKFKREQIEDHLNDDPRVFTINEDEAFDGTNNPVLTPVIRVADAAEVIESLMLRSREQIIDRLQWYSESESLDWSDAMLDHITDALLLASGVLGVPAATADRPLTTRPIPEQPTDQMLEQMASAAIMSHWGGDVIAIANADQSEVDAVGYGAIWRNGCDTGMVAP